MYSYGQIKTELIDMLNSIPAMRVTYFKRKHEYRVKCKEHNRFISGEECFNKIKFLTETNFRMRINWDYLVYKISDKEVIFFGY